MKNWIIVLTFFSLWLTSMFDDEVQRFLAYGVILTVGVLHGANDVTLISVTSKKKGNTIQLYRVLLYYILTVLAILGIFFIYPPLALCLFILISSYHFGEQHLKKTVKKESLGSKLFYFFYGLTILFLIFFLNLEKTIPVFTEVTGFTPNAIFFQAILIVAVLGLILTFTMLSHRKLVKLNIVKEVFSLLVLMLVFKVADLLWAFSIYFVLWHSIPSLKDQIELLHGKAEMKGLLTYLKTSWLYWSASIVGLVILYFLFQDNREYFISILVYFLAAITFPHVIVMSKIEEGR